MVLSDMDKNQVLQDRALIEIMGPKFDTFNNDLDRQISDKIQCLTGDLN